MPCCSLNSSGEVYSSQLSKGFQRVAAGLADTALDNPAAPERFARLLDAAGTANLLEPEVLAGLAADTGRKTNGAALHANGGGSGGGANALAQLGASPGTAGSLLGGAGVPAFKMAMGAALREFFNSADADEVAARYGAAPFAAMSWGSAASAAAAVAVATANDHCKCAGAGGHPCLDSRCCSGWAECLCIVPCLFPSLPPAPPLFLLPQPI